jgi:DNA modification methylase
MDDLGSIWAAFEGNRFFVGSLEIDSEEEAVQKAIERIKKGSGIL